MRIIDIDDPKTWGQSLKVSNCKYWDKYNSAWVYEFRREVRGVQFGIQVMAYVKIGRKGTARLIRKARHQMRSLVLANS